MQLHAGQARRSRTMTAATRYLLPLLLLGKAVDLSAQENLGGSLPAHFPLNPMAVSRTGLYAQPYADPVSGWSASLSVDYGSSVEWEEAPGGANYVLDAELLRIQLLLRRDFAARHFVQFAVDVNGAFDGFADAAFDWYHSAIGIGFRGREQRPQNVFRYSLHLPAHGTLERTRATSFIGDLRLGYGIRHTSLHQTTLSITLPTSTAPAGYSRRIFAAAAIHTLRVPTAERWTFEATAGAGYTPAWGDMAPLQNEIFASASAGARVRLFGAHSVYGYLFAHSPYYDDTTLPELESGELTGDFGWIVRTGSGRELRIGLTEDLGPKDHGIDLVLRLGINW